jgi:hypothetical protein
MWAGTGCGGSGQELAAISGPWQVPRGGTIAWAEAVGARPIVDAVAATASAAITHPRKLCRVLIAQSPPIRSICAMKSTLQA